MDFRHGWPRLFRRLVRRRPPHLREIASRRRFLMQGLLLLAAGFAAGLRWLHPNPSASREGAFPRGPAGGVPIRPPGARPVDADFRRACIRCGLCGSVCANGCIRFFGLDRPQHGALTPYLDVRRRSCILCMRCTQICPTGALSPVGENLDDIARDVDMGTAVVDPDRCLSYQGRICGICHDACPLPNRAIRLVPKGRPVVIPEGCVGCGRCVELCPQKPTAIDVLRLEA